MNTAGKQPVPGFWGAIGIIALAKIAFPAPIVVAALIAGAVLGVPDAHTHPAVETLSLFAAAIGVTWFYRRQTGTGIGELFGPFPRRPLLLLPFLAAVAGYTMLQSAVTAAATLSFPSFAMGGSQKSLHYKPYVFAAVGLAAPLAEEITYRGVILRGLVPRYGYTRAILLSAALFSLLHINPIQLPSTFLFGVLTAWLALRTRSLWPGLLFHAVTNTIFVAQAVSAYNDQYLAGLLRESHPAPAAAFIVAALTLLAAGVFSIRRGTMETQ